MNKTVPHKFMSRKLSQGLGSKGGPPGPLLPAPGPFSSAAQRLTQLEDGLNEVWQADTLVLIDRIASNSKEIELLPKEILETNWRAARELDIDTTGDEVNYLKLGQKRLRANGQSNMLGWAGSIC